jgi:hypothetical protein
MPLIKSPSKEAVSENIRTEMHAGKPQKQAVAIALDVARRSRRKKKRYASGGSPTNPALWGVDEEELPAGIGLSPMTAAAGHIAKGVLWDLPHRAIDAAKGTSYGLRREDFTDVPPDYSPDPSSPLGGVGIAVPKGAWQPTDELIGASLEGAANVMGGTALSAPAKAAGEVVAGAGPTRRLPRVVPEKPREYPIAPRDEWYGDANYQATGGQMAKMSPDDFLARARPLEIDDISRENINSLKQHIEEGRTLDPLALYRTGKEDGRHRAHAAKELGIKEVPVLTWPDKPITFGAGATDKRAAALAAADDILAQEARLTGAAPSTGWTGTGYHGTASDFDKFTPSAPFNKLTGKSDVEGVYFSGDPMQASQYARMAARREGAGKQRVIAADLAMNNPLDITKLIKNGQRRGLSFGDAKRAAMEKLTPEHDGVIFHGNSANPPEYIAFNNDQITRKPLTLGSGATDKRAASLATVDDVLDAERRLAGATHEPAPNLGTAERPAAATDPGKVGSGGGGTPGARSLDEAQAAAARWAGTRPTLEGQQGPLKIGGDYFVPGPIGKIHDVAEDYMRTVHPDRPYTPPTKYHPIDPEHSKAIAQAYDDMKHTPNDPATKASYDALIDETAKQYQAIKATGLKIEPIPAGAPDPYAANPRLAARDVAENNHLWFFPTEGGFGTVNKITDNPMLRKTGEKIGDHELLANDMFRVVHDYFGHLKEGHGFRAAGEDNAWRTHAQMYSDLARPAMTTETRGQNSWVNYGPHGEKNRTASGADTTYADQKVGLMPEWTMRDRGSPEPIIAYHGSPYSFDRFSTQHLGAGEGNQAYGHGLYFAGHSPVSEWYRHQLASRRDPLLKKYGLDSQDGAQVGMAVAQANGDAAAVAADFRKYAADLRAEGHDDMATTNMIKRAEGKASYLEDAERAKGHMYEVAIDARPEHMLDYDATLGQQPPAVQQAFQKQIEQFGPEAKMEGQFKIASSRHKQGMRGLTEDLKKAGVRGIRYLDQFSRGLGGSHNYVAFDDNMVKILRKYGIIGIPAAGVLGADGEERRATGGSVNAALEVARAIKRKKGGRVHVGPIVGDTGGRADKVPMSVPDGAYVIPADIVSGLGEGNTGAGMVQLGKMFPKSKPRIMRESPGAVPILAADGEFVVSPQSILDRWDDLAYGHQALDAWVLHERQQLIETLEGLAPPAQD